MNDDILYLGGILSNKCTWSGHISPSIISTPFHAHSVRKISLISNLFPSKNTFRLYFGANTTRAQECGIRREYASMWAGHKADTSITSNVYTHLEQNKNVQIEEMKKFQYKI